MIAKQLQTPLFCIILLCTALFLASCSTPTLQEYCEDNPEEWTAIQEQVAEMESGLFTQNISVEENEVSQTLTYSDTFSEESLATMASYFESQKAAIQKQLRASVQQLADKAGIQNITWKISYLNGDGANIYSATLDAEGNLVSSDAAKDANDTSQDSTPADESSTSAITETSSSV